MENECKGCLSCPNDQITCKVGMVPHLSETESCPCLNCLVKGVCDETCYEFRKYTRQHFIYEEMKAC